MTNRNQNFELGTPGATLTTSNAGGTGNTQFNTVTIQGGCTAVFDNSLASQGSQSIAFTAASGASVNARYTGMSSTAFAASVYVYLTTAPTADLFLFTATASGSTVARALLAFTSGAAKLRMIDTRGTTTPVWTATSAFPLNQWVRVEVYCTVNAGAASYQAAYYLADSSTAVEAMTPVTNANTGSTAIDTFILGKNDSSAYTSTVRYDGLQTNDAATGLIGRWPATAATSVRPNAVSSNTGTFTNQGGAASLSAAVADESDTTYIQSADNPTTGSIVYLFPTLAAGDVTVKTRDQMSLSSPATHTLVELIQLPSTVVSSRAWALSTSWVDNSWTTDPTTETPLITDRSNLALRITDYVG